VKKYPKVISLHLKFDDVLAHKIYAGCDFFLMPSRYEPCGLGQLISLRYGTIPIVFKTGGLADTIDKNNGFIFSLYKQEELVKTIQASLAAFKNKKQLDTLIANAMKCNFSWETSAKAYIRVYEKLRAK
jgi:starch synthase